MLAALFMFLMRYIGLIGAGIVGLLGFYYLFKKQWRNMVICWFAGSIPLVLAGLYLLKNYADTGLMTGMERVPSIETPAEFLYMLYEGIMGEMNIFSTDSNIFMQESLIFVLLSVFIFIRWKHIKSLFQIQQYHIPFLFLFTGMVYFIVIVYMRWSAYFDPLGFRLLAPTTLMVWLFLVGWIAQVKEEAWRRWRSTLIVILGAACLFNIGYKSFTSLQDATPTYQETISEVEEMYNNLPEDSIVAFENIHARYVRPDLQYIKVHFRPYFAEDETYKHFMNRITPNHAQGVYFAVPTFKEYRFHQSFVELMENAEAREDFIKVE
ncbi:hypothetical protein GCM10008986_10530 [Salinibacillus aidingensis]|uniref:Dolichyl-phosphate-mannose-protein mannosyltransferase n=2 Tax=Salinibacillus aidingensis TaxID=237684 RepID=A0ABP3KTW6_9BACI